MRGHFSLLFLVIVSAVCAQASVFTLTQTPDIAMGSYVGPTNGDPGTPTRYSHYELFWDFTALPGWLSGGGTSMHVNSVTITVSLGSFHLIDGWGSTILDYAGAEAISMVPIWGSPGYSGLFDPRNPGPNNDWFDVYGVYTVRPYFLFGQPFTRTFTPGVDGFASDLVMNDGGRFWTRVGHLSGNFTLSSYQVQIDADQVVPEPATFVLFGSALLGLGLIRRALPPPRDGLRAGLSCAPRGAWRGRRRA